MDDRERLLASVFVRLADTLVDEFDVVEFLGTLSAAALEVLSADAAGVMLVGGDGALHLIASSEERMRVLELFELQQEQGPCVDAFLTGAPVLATTDECRERWPSFAPLAAASGFQQMSAVPLRVRDSVIGALNLFRSTDVAFTTTELELAQSMAQVAAIGVLQQRASKERELLSEQLAVALTSRIVIEQAKGMLAEQLDVDLDIAFAALRRRARDTNCKLTDLAKQVTERRLDHRAFTT